MEKDTNTTEGCIWRFVKILLGAVILYVCLTLTNPTFDDYKQHVREKVSADGNDIFSRVDSYIVFEAATDLVVRYDYKAFSVYELTGPMGEKYYSFGILKLFLDYK
jgi:ABC-type transport system involved in Fe-S cluster assembly fused permease/ATPase subunit